MKKKLLLAISLVVVFVGCGQQPQLDVNADQNKTVAKNPVKKQNVEENKTVENNNSSVQPISNTQPVETDLTDNSSNLIENNVTENSVMVSQNNGKEKLAKVLSGDVVHFDFDKYNIKSSQLPIVEAVANQLNDVKGNFTVRIEGNCDEWGSDEYNYALGLKRAKIVKEALINLGVDKNKLTIISYGESNPVCTAHNKTCWAKNRRDNFTLLP